MIEVDELKQIHALRTFAKHDELDQAGTELLKKAKEMEYLPCTMEFSQMPEYEATSEYHIVLWCT